MSRGREPQVARLRDWWGWVQTLARLAQEAVRGAAAEVGKRQESLKMVQKVLRTVILVVTSSSLGW